MSEPPLAVFAPVLETKRLTMKLMNLEKDVHILAEIMNVFLSGKDGFEWDIERATRLMRNLTLSPSNCLGLKAPGPAAYMLYLGSETGPTVGFVSLNERRPDVPPDVGFVLRPEYQNQGYGTEAATAFLNYFIHDFGLKNICAMVFLPNERSVNLIGKLGFESGGDAVLEPWGVTSVFVLPGMKHLSKETTTVSRWGVDK
ncbi:hypothetical protein N431DRAFT_375884 [Stipitochalara longipes BDJ]|nr:hypothetical protein N431DRAFT_375884 [Stipitochalara longipes BDJ]